VKVTIDAERSLTSTQYVIRREDGVVISSPFEFKSLAVMAAIAAGYKVVEQGQEHGR